MNTADIETFMRAASHGTYDVNAIRAFCATAADTIKELRGKLPVWRDPAELTDHPSSVLILLTKDREIAMAGHVAGMEAAQKFLGWMTVADLVGFYMENPDAKYADQNRA